jgi:F0F1-type ATP synthase assembly protein I
MKRLITALLIAVGVVLMIAQIRAESEPGAIPLALIGLGLGLHFIRRVRNRRHS